MGPSFRSAAFAMSLPPRTASELARVRAQIRAGRLEWQDSTEPEAHIPVEHYVSEKIRDAEVERLFRPLPLIAGHASELGPGRVASTPDLLARGVRMGLVEVADAWKLHRAMVAAGRRPGRLDPGLFGR